MASYSVTYGTKEQAENVCKAGIFLIARQVMVQRAMSLCVVTHVVLYTQLQTSDICAERTWQKHMCEPVILPKHHCHGRSPTNDVGPATKPLLPESLKHTGPQG